MNMSKKLKIASSIVALFVLANAYLLLKDNDIILKKYYINDAHFAVAKDHEKILSNDEIVSSNNEHFIAAPVQAVNEVLVTEGQTVDAYSELVLFKPEEAEKETARLENELAAYETEMFELENIVSQLELEASDAYPTSTMDSTSIRDNESWNIDLSIELGIEQSTPTAEGIAIIQRSIAETTRQIDILHNRISQLSENNTLTSPVEGIVKEIILEGDSITFNIQSADKKLVVYVTPKQWQKIAVDQTAEMILFEGEDNEITVEGTVVEKQQIPARDSIAFEEMKKHEKVDEDKTVYEVSILPNEELLDTPVGTLATANITVNEAANSFGVQQDWLVQVENDEDEESDFIYMLNESGNTVLVPVEEYFSYKAKLDQHEALHDKTLFAEFEDEDIEESDEPADDVAEEPTPPRIQTVQLKDKKEQTIDEPELEDVSVISGPQEPYQIFLNEKERNLYAPTFRAYPLQSFDHSNIDSNWKSILNYLLK